MHWSLTRSSVDLLIEDLSYCWISWMKKNMVISWSDTLFFFFLFSAQLKVFIEGLFSFNQDIPAFKEHLRDFLVQIRVSIRVVFSPHVHVAHITGEGGRNWLSKRYVFPVADRFLIPPVHIAYASLSVCLSVHPSFRPSFLPSVCHLTKNQIRKQELGIDILPST